MALPNDIAGGLTAGVVESGGSGGAVYEVQLDGWLDNLGPTPDLPWEAGHLTAGVVESNNGSATAEWAPHLILPEVSDMAADHYALALDRLAQYLKGRTNVLSVLAVATARHQTIEAALQALLSDRVLSTAYGELLDVIGDIVGQPRGGMLDADYRKWINVKILALLSSGTSEEILKALSLVTPVGATLRLRDEWPAGFTVEIDDAVTTAALAALIIAVLRLLRGAGIRGLLEWYESTDVFTFDGAAGDTGFDVGAFKGAIL